MILVCGEALFDLFAGAELGDYALAARPGGSQFNVAVALSRLGVETHFMGGVSTDILGQRLLATLLAAGVRTELAKLTSHPTPLALVSQSPSGQPEYVFHTHNTAEQAFSIKDLPVSLPAPCRAIALGSYTLSTGPAADAWLAFARRHCRDSVIAVDPNLRLPLVGALHAWRTRLDAFVSVASVVKLSEEDLSQGWPGTTRVEDLVNSWLDRGVRLVVVTHGANGASAWWQGGHIRKPGRVVQVVDTVGAGDTFQAALLAGLLERDKLLLQALSSLDPTTVAAVLEDAIVASSLTCTRRGADSPYLEDVRMAPHRQS
jgi:fructokinase